jgi:hypothetical protein
MTIRIVLVLSTAWAVSSCERPARSASYFFEHPTERGEVLSGCKAGSVRGRECETAAAADAKATDKAAENFFRAGIGAK